MLAGITPKRKLLQWLATLLLLGLPFLTREGESLLRLDAPTRTLLFLGARIRIEEFYLVLLLALIGVFGFLLVTMLLGRVWCGWFCPQTTLSDLCGWIDDRIKRLVQHHVPALLLRHCCYLLLSFLVAADLLWYVVPPAQFFHQVTAGTLGPASRVTLVCTVALLYFDLGWVRRGFCKTVCPYGRIQLLTMDRNTLTLEYPESSLSRCIHCDACERACPMGIDIRRGLQIECINCGRCLDACRTVMAKAKQRPLIRYSFGDPSQGGGRPWNGRTVAMAGLLALLGALFFYQAEHRVEATVKLQRSATAEAKRLADGSVVNFYTGFIENRSTHEESYSLVPSSTAGVKLELMGPVTSISLAPNQNRRIDFVAKAAPAPRRPRTLELRLVRDGRVIATTPLPILVP